jgi:hypothetical protein
LRRDLQKLPLEQRVSLANNSEEIFMRPAIAIVLACLALAACGSSRRTVIVNPPADSTTVVERDGTTHVIPNN